MTLPIFILGLLFFLAGGFVFVWRLKKFLANPIHHELDKKDIVVLSCSLLAASIGGLLLEYALFLFHPEWQTKTVYGEGVYEGQSIQYSLQIALALSGAFFFVLVNGLLWGSFTLHYWDVKMKEPQRKIFTRILFASIPFLVLFFLFWTCGMAPYLSYPLISGMHFDGGFGWDTTASRGSFHIAWYGVIILFGVCVAYWIADHKFYQEFHKHGILDTVVLIAFPIGILGARLWYVVGNFEREFAGREWWRMFMISDGGLTILGGAFAGVLAGVIFLKRHRPYVNLGWAMDVCVPAILLAQAIGRWGNFFNVEVYGKEVALSSGWSWLPNWLALQMNCNSQSLTHLGTGMIHVPLFLIEGVLSVVGYFVIVYGIGKGLKKYTVKGDLAGIYFIWYGLVRVVMEPMRDTAFNMGTNNAWSICNSIVYIVLGFLVVTMLHFREYLLKDGAKKEIVPVLSGIFALLALVFPLMQSFTGTYRLGSSTSIQSYSGFQVLFSFPSPFYLVAYFLIASAGILFLTAFVLFLRKKDKNGFYVIVGAIAFDLLGALFFFLGKNTVALPTSYFDGTTTYTLQDQSLSYGFVLTALFALFSAGVGLSLLLAIREKKKETEREKANA